MSISQILPQSFVWTRLGIVGILKEKSALSYLTPEEASSHASPVCSPSDVSRRGTDPVGVACPCALHPPGLSVPVSLGPADRGTRSAAESPGGRRDAL